MSETVSSLPSRPLTERELQSLDDATAYCRDPDTGEAYIIVYISENSVSALGYEDRRDGWVQFHSRDTEFSEEAAQNLDDEIKGWTQARYGRQIDAGDLRMTGPYDPTPERDEAKEMPWGGQTGARTRVRLPGLRVPRERVDQITAGLSPASQKGARIRRQRSNGDSQRLTPTRRQRHPTRRPPVRARRDTPPRRATRRASASSFTRCRFASRGDAAHNPPKRLDSHLAVATQ